MANPNITAGEIQKMISGSMGSRHVATLWTAETQELNLFQTKSNDDEKIKRLSEHFGKLTSELTNEFSEGIEKLIECKIEQGEAKIISGSALESSINPEEKIGFKWKSHDGVLSGYYAFDKSLFFKIYDLLFGGKRVFVKKSALSSFEKEALNKIINIFHSALQSSYYLIAVPQTELQEIISDISLIAKDLSNSNLVQYAYHIKQETEALGSFEIYFPYEILKSFSDTVPTTTADNLVHDNLLAEAVKYCVQDVKVKIQVELGKALAPLKEVLAVNSESQWELRISENGHLLEVFNQPIALTSMGEANGYRAVQILERFNEE